jgi:hypothetical protein
MGTTVAPVISLPVGDASLSEVDLHIAGIMIRNGLTPAGLREDPDLARLAVLLPAMEALTSGTARWPR